MYTLVQVDTRPCKVGNFSWSEVDLKPSRAKTEEAWRAFGARLSDSNIVEDNCLSLGLHDSFDPLC